MLKIYLLATFTLLMLSCGGGEHEPREEKTLHFIDSPVNGIDYRCGERQGITKSYEQNGITEQGVLKCVYAPLELSLGLLDLGEIESFRDGQKIYPQDLVPSFNGNFNNIEVLKRAILLQSLDDKSSSDHINIPNSIKEQISISSLDGLSIEELNREIQRLGKTPVSPQDAKVHLLLNSGGGNIGKPIIELFEEDISTSMTTGSTIGKLSIDEGGSELIYPLVLEGIGKENFILNKKGSLRLAKSLDTTATYNLTVTAINQFGYTKQPITIFVKDGTKIGKAQMGRLSDAKVTLSRLNSDNTQTLIYTTTTKSTGGLNRVGNFDLKDDMLDDDSFYIYEISGGEDIDCDNNGKVDKNITPNSGRLRLITKGIWIKNATYKIRVTPLSEMLYSYIEETDYSKLEENLHKYAKILLKKSLDGDSTVDAKDIILFDPLSDRDLLYDTLKYDNTYTKIVDKIRDGDIDYKDDLFSAYTIESFPANAIEIVGTSIYTIDMMGSGEFRIYDLETKELIGSLKLPHTPYSSNTHTLYINLLENQVIVGSLSDWSCSIDITDQKNLSIIGEPYIVYSVLSGNFSRMAIGKSHGANLLSKNRKYYIYSNSSLNKTQKIKLFKTDKESATYLYGFDSQLSTIDSLWIQNNYLYIVGDKKMHIFVTKNSKMVLKQIYNKREIRGDIIGIEDNILYLLSEKRLTLIDINSIENPKFIEEITVPFSYRLGVKTNGKYITTESKIVDIATLRVSKKTN